MIKIPYKHIIETKNKKLIEYCLLYLFSIFFYETKELIYNNHYITFSSFTPLPTKFLLDCFKDIYIDDEFIYITSNVTDKNRIIFADRILPFASENPVPFSFPIKTNNSYELINSNVFYYEITIKEQVIQSWINEALVIGYGSVYANKISNPGWRSNTFGYHLDDGTYQYNGNVIKNFGPISKIGDVFGAGIIFISDSLYQPFFTINGKLIEKKLPEITIIQKITPMIGFDYSHKIKYNFGKNEFKFNIKDYLQGRQLISLTNLFFEKKNQKKEFNITKLKQHKNLIDNLEENTQFVLLNNIISELSQQQGQEQNFTINEPLFLNNQQNNFFSFTLN
jgi:hypothetical protein